MKKYLVSLVLLVALVLGSVGIVSAQSLTSVQGVIANTTSVYAEPSESAEVQGELEAGTTVSVLRSSDNQAWYEIEAGDVVGYVAVEDVVLLSSPLLAGWAWAPSDSAGVAVFAGPDLNTEILSTMNYGDVAMVLGASGDQWLVVSAPDGAVGFALASSLESLPEGSAVAVVTVGSTDAAGLFAEANVSGEIAGSVDPGTMVYTLGAPGDQWAEVLVPGGEMGYMLVDNLMVLPQALVGTDVSRAAAGVYAEPDFTADVLGEVSDTAYFLGSVDDFWLELYAPSIGEGYGLKDNFTAPMVVGEVIYANSIVRQGPNDSIYKAIAQLPAGMQLAVLGTSENGAWYQVIVPFDQIDFPSNGLSGWINADLVSVDASGLAVTE